MSHLKRSWDIIESAKTQSEISRIPCAKRRLASPLVEASLIIGVTNNEGDHSYQEVHSDPSAHVSTDAGAILSASDRPRSPPRRTSPQTIRTGSPSYFLGNGFSDSSSVCFGVVSFNFHISCRMMLNGQRSY